MLPILAGLAGALGAAWLWSSRWTYEIGPPVQDSPAEPVTPAAPPAVPGAFREVPWYDRLSESDAYQESVDATPGAALASDRAPWYATAARRASEMGLE